MKNYFNKDILLRWAKKLDLKLFLMVSIFVLAFFISTFGFVSSAQAAASFIKSATGVNNNTTSGTATLSSAPTAGNLLIATIGTKEKNVTIATPTGWSVAIKNNGNITAPLQAIFYKISNGSDGSVTITTSANVHAAISILEYSGVSVLDAVGTTRTGNTTTPTSNSVTASQTNQLILISSSEVGGTSYVWTGANKITDASQGSNATNSVADILTTTSGSSYSASATITRNNWRTDIVSFKEAPPTGTFSSATQNTDGTGKVVASIIVNDAEHNNSKAKIEYSTSATCATGRVKATLVNPITATVTPAPDLTQANAYQIGATTPILTSSANTVTFIWDSKTDLPSATGSTNYYLCITANDGTVDQTTIGASSAIKVDNTNPTSVILTPTDNSYSTSTVALTGTSSDTNLSTTTISIDGGAFVATGGAATSWTYSATGLSQSTHTFQTKATDLAGNTGLSVIVHVTVDNVAPETTLLTHPNNPSNLSSASFTFSSEVGATFQCDLDSAGYSLCTSPKNYSSLSDNSHTFSVKATDTAGNTDLTPATFTWTIDTTAPTNQDVVFATSITKQVESTVTVVSSGDATNSIWFAPAGTTSFAAGLTMTTAEGTATSILAPATVGNYKMFVIDASGNISAPSTATLTTISTTKFVIINPTDGTVGAPITITVQAQQADNSIDTTYQNDVTLATDGFATGGGLVDIQNGIGTINISDTVAQTVNLSLSDSQHTGLNVDSTQNVVFAASSVKQFILNDPGDIYAKTRGGYTVTRKDEYGNLVTSGTTVVNLSTTSISTAAKFYDDATAGSVITSINIAEGHSYTSFWYYDEEPGTYIVSAKADGVTDGTDSIIVIPVATKFVILPVTGITVDAPATITVQAQKPDNSVDINYQYDVKINVSGSASVPSGGLVNIINGIGTINISDTIAESIALSLADSQTTGLDVSSTQTVDFAGGNVAQFVLSNATVLSAGSRAKYTVTRKDQYNNLTTSGDTAVYLFSSSMGANKKFYDAIAEGNVVTSVVIANGQSSADFWYYEEAPGTYTITASDSFPADGNNNINDAADLIDVVAGPASKYILNDPGDVYIGTRIKYTVTRKDQYNNITTAGASTIYLYSSSGTGSFFDAEINGNAITNISIIEGSSSADFWYYDQTPGIYTITASDSAVAPDTVGIIDGTDSITISSVPIVATRFVIVNPTDGTVDAPIVVTIKATDDSGNVDTTYQTDVTLVTSGSATGSGLVDIQNGIGTINISDTAVETVNLSLSDSQTTELNVSSTQDVVFSVGAARQFSLDNPGDMSAGTRIKYTVTRKDQYGNLVAGGLTQVYLYGSPSAATKKFYDSESAGSVITFINIADGSSSAQFWYYDEIAGTSSVIVSDNSEAPDGSVGISDISDEVAVSAGPVAKFVLSNPGDMTASTRLGYTVSRQDKFGNPVSSGVTLVYLYTSSTGAEKKFYDSAIGGLVVNSVAIDNGNSSASFWYYDTAAGTWVITVSDGSPVANGSTGVVDDADSVTVSTIPIVATRFVILNPGNSSINVPVSVTVQAEDVDGNIDTTYQNDVTLVTSGSATGGGLVNIVNGVGSLQINDLNAETILLSLSDTEATGLNISSTVQIIFSALPESYVGGISGLAYIPPVSKVVFSGRVYPGASLSIAAIAETENVIKQETIPSSDGNFEIIFSGLSTGSKAFALLIQDKDGRAAQTKIYDLNLLDASSNLEVKNILASPTIGFPRPTITKGDFLTIVGYATPQSKLLVEVDGKAIDAEITAGADGAYKYLYNTAILELGSHTIRARQITSDGVQSEFSPQKVFFTTNLTVPKTDFNNDGKLNISDWSIFLSRWFSNDETVKLLDDLNGDKKLDATDFSIFIRTLRQ